MPLNLPGSGPPPPLQRLPVFHWRTGPSGHRRRFPGGPASPSAPPRPSSAPCCRSLIGLPSRAPLLPFAQWAPPPGPKIPPGASRGSAATSSLRVAVTAAAGRREGRRRRGGGRRRRSKGVGEKTSERNRKPAAAAAAAALGVPGLRTSRGVCGCGVAPGWLSRRAAEPSPTLGRSGRALRRRSWRCSRALRPALLRRLPGEGGEGAEKRKDVYFGA